MAFASCQLTFMCDSCKEAVYVYPDMELENIPKLMEWVEYAFDEDANRADRRIFRHEDKHLCNHCYNRVRFS